MKPCQKKGSSNCQGSSGSSSPLAALAYTRLCLPWHLLALALALLSFSAMAEAPQSVSSSALTVKPEWLSLILSGCKTWELRSKPCRKDPKAFVALLASGTSTVWGFCQIDGSGSRWRSLRQLQSASARSKHQVSEKQLQGYLGKAPVGAYAWRLRRPRVLVSVQKRETGIGMPQSDSDARSSGRCGLCGSAACGAA